MGDVEKTLEQQIDDELELWNKMGTDPSIININQFMLDRQVHAMMQLLMDKEIFTKDELDQKYREIVLPELQRIRKELEPQLAAAKLKMGIDKFILGPNGEILSGPNGQ